MIIYLAHGETLKNQKLLIEAKVSGVLLSYKILSQESDEYIHKLLSGYENYVAIMIDPNGEQPEKYLEWACRFHGYNKVSFLEPKLSNKETSRLLRKQAYQQDIALIPIWRLEHQSNEDFEELCKEYPYVAVEGVSKQQQFIELLRIT